MTADMNPEAASLSFFAELLCTWTVLQAKQVLPLFPVDSPEI